ncbi:MAG: hypothetical protein VB099_21075 [Candidatus Limiplasma sp.]|nr:hypothetical protein [Candidatus Limiplasma sp.]
MKEITYQFEPVPKLSVNGHVFELQMSDGDIFDRAMKISEKYIKLNKDSSVKQIMKAVRECADIIDEILGPGAMAAIAQGRPVGVKDSLKLMNRIVTEAAGSYTERLKDYE